MGLHIMKQYKEAISENNRPPQNLQLIQSLENVPQKSHERNECGKYIYDRNFESTMS